MKEHRLVFTAHLIATSNHHNNHRQPYITKMGTMSSMDCCINDEDRIRAYEDRIRKEQQEAKLLQDQYDKLMVEAEKTNGKKSRIATLKQEKKQIFEQMLKEKKRAGELMQTANKYKRQIDKLKRELNALEIDEP